MAEQKKMVFAMMCLRKLEMMPVTMAETMMSTPDGILFGR